MSSQLAALAIAAAGIASAQPVSGPPVEAPPVEAPLGALTSFAALPGWTMADPRPALQAFRVSCRADRPATPPATATAHEAPPSAAALAAACSAAAAPGADAEPSRARRFFETFFAPRLVSAAAFFTGYYEPVVEGSLTPSADFAVPLYAAPPDLVRVQPGQAAPGLDPSLTAARRLPDGRLVAMPDRAAIEAGALAAEPIVYLHDRVAAYVVQVQGSARIKLTNGLLRRLIFAGRNGYPYTSIGKILVARLGVAPSAMGMAQLEAWLRANGQGARQAGGRLMQQNRSYIFFRFDDALPVGAGPIGGDGVSLDALASLAVDHRRWPYGIPFYLDARLPIRGPETGPFRRLMIAQDTGSAIVGEARADIFYGSGPDAGRQAGAIHHTGALYVLWPRDGTRAP